MGGRGGLGSADRREGRVEQEIELGDGWNRHLGTGNWPGALNLFELVHLGRRKGRLHVLASPASYDEKDLPRVFPQFVKTPFASSGIAAKEK